MALAGAACSATLTPSPSAIGTPTPVAFPPSLPASVEPDPTAPQGLALPTPGRPFDAAAILTILRESQRPDGVAPELLTDSVASAVADAVWTFDGRPWTTADATGTCGPAICTLEVAGTRPGARGDDLWVLEVDRASGRLEVGTAVLQGLPAQLVGELDAVARPIAPAGILDDALLTGVRWLPPPATGSFVLGYRTGGDEGSCAVDLTIDAGAPEILDVQTRDC